MDTLFLRQSQCTQPTCTRMMIRLMKHLMASCNITAVVVKNMSPPRVRTYRIDRINTAFWAVSNTKLVIFKNAPENDKFTLATST